MKISWIKFKENKLFKTGIEVQHGEFCLSPFSYDTVEDWIIGLCKKPSSIFYNEDSVVYFQEKEEKYEN